MPPLGHPEMPQGAVGSVLAAALPVSWWWACVCLLSGPRRDATFSEISVASSKGKPQARCKGLPDFRSPIMSDPERHASTHGADSCCV
ncbi:hypothetical protein Micbo1qcDRAFT_167736, partial [Microdochium bolleyi]